MRKPILPIALAIAVVAGSGTLAVAAGHDDDGPRGPWIEHRIDHLLDAVDATDAQRTQIQAIAEKYEPQMKALHEQMHQLHERMHDEVAAILTDEQKAKLEDEEGEHHRHFRHSKG